MTTTDRDLTDHHAAGSLADELPYWGWLADDRTCLTRRGELLTLARLSPTVVDGHTPEQLDHVLQRWQRMLSGIDPHARIYFYLLRRPAAFPHKDGGLSPIADLGQRKRRAFLATRIQQIHTYLAWCFDPRFSSTARGRNNQPWWKGYVPDVDDAEEEPERGDGTSASRSRPRPRAFGRWSMPAGRSSRTSRPWTSSRRTRARACWPN